MENFAELGKILRRIDSTAKKIIHESLKLMKQLQTEDCEFVDDLIDARELDDNTVDRGALLQDLQNASLGWTDDAEKVRDEINNFILENDGTYVVNIESGECPFLTEVWSGDVYDQIEVDGMKALLSDLTSQLANITGENLVERATHVEV